MRGEGETTDGAFRHLPLEEWRWRGVWGPWVGWEWEWAGTGEEVAKALAKKMANGEVLTHQSDISENLTAGPKGRDGTSSGIVRANGKIWGILTRYFSTGLSVL